jgi:hypothetical protein
MRAQLAVRRVGTLAEIAAAVLYLAPPTPALPSAPTY